MNESRRPAPSLGITSIRRRTLSAACLCARRRVWNWRRDDHPGTPYVVVYNDSDGAFYLQNFFGNPYNDRWRRGFWGSDGPNSSFVFPIGQAISRTIYARFFSLVGTTYGGGDGSPTFNLPDRRGRVSAQLDPTASILNSFSMSPDANTLGAKGVVRPTRLPSPKCPLTHMLIRLMIPDTLTFITSQPFRPHRMVVGLLPLREPTHR
jgi:hypothetical protein